jgi:hypothetical protein
MLAGAQFRLSADTIGIEGFNGRRAAVQIPAGSVITVESGPRPDDQRMVEVQWDGRRLVMFAEDIEQRGERSARSQTDPGPITHRLSQVALSTDKA